MTSVANGALPNDSTAGTMDEDFFCRQNYGYILDGYLYYIDKFDITTANYSTHPQYISFGQFGATGLNFGYNDYADYFCLLIIKKCCKSLLIELCKNIFTD